MTDKKLTEEIENLDRVLERMEVAANRLQDVAQGRVYVVGTKIIYSGKFGVVTNLNQGSEDPLASTVDLRLEDGTTFENVSVNSTTLELLRQ